MITWNASQKVSDSKHTNNVHVIYLSVRVLQVLESHYSDRLVHFLCVHGFIVINFLSFAQRIVNKDICVDGLLPVVYTHTHTHTQSHTHMQKHI